MDIIKNLLTDEAFLNAAIAGLSLVLTFFLNRAVGAFQAATGIRIEEKHMRALHSAIITGVESALKEGPEAGIDNIKNSALRYARQSVPDAVRALVPGQGVMDKIAERYVMERLNRIGG
ncbi:hypothetical protein GGR95_002975 [Sulfitobacter undariae]|uniref:Bacteriophage holin of superfamily 6 (Holin_LLH) n=1 Tax=Sulfitobacter undariae TaxID=1563671 RepID=A0A7W6E5W6_9RHOB|nr:hypothetical protein [Sulfitobacter undariae]MBB3995320.1 hypothetical protein [Sulfitobacter undariae]